MERKIDVSVNENKELIIVFGDEKQKLVVSVGNDAKYVF